MKRIKYKIGEDEDIGQMPYGAMVECYLVCGGGSEGGLVYMPKRVKYEINGETGIDVGCGSLMFAREDDEYYIKHYDDYINLDPKDAKEFEGKIKKGLKKG